MARGNSANSFTCISHYIIGRLSYQHNLDKRNQLRLRHDSEPSSEYISAVKQKTKPKTLTKKMPNKNYRAMRYTISPHYTNACRFLKLKDAKDALLDLEKPESAENEGEGWNEFWKGKWALFGIPSTPIFWTITNGEVFYKGFLNDEKVWIYNTQVRVPYFGIHQFTKDRNLAKFFGIEDLLLFSIIVSSLNKHFETPFGPSIDPVNLTLNQDPFTFFTNKVFILPSLSEVHSQGGKHVDPFEAFDLAMEDSLEGEQGEHLGQNTQEPDPIPQGPMEAEVEPSSLVLGVELPSSSSLEQAFFGNNFPPADFLPQWDLDWMEEQEVTLFPSLNDLLPDQEDPCVAMWNFSYLY
jgi:hypothetical protein